MVYKLEMIRSSGALSKDDLNQSFIYQFHVGGNFVMEIGDEFHLIMMTLIAGGLKKLAFDFSELKYIDSTGIGILINVAKQIRARGGDVVLFNINPRIQEILRLVKLHDFIPFFKSQKQVSEHFFTA